MLRGCIGHLEATLPLVEDVAENAFSAAFRDPRFPALRDTEYAALELHISVLTPAEPLDCNSESDLLRQMRPYQDGLILAEGLRRGTFLPSVWEQLPEPREFLRHLKRKAGLPDDYWSPSLQIYRYETESFS
jgi:AmmeMemoRadiSam system protein A